jgi:cytolysin (calcineurin-like family phosphatase)
MLSALPWLRLLLVVLGAAGPAKATAAPTVTFLVTGDSHFGASGMDRLNRTLVQQMNELPGVEWPATFGGSVGPMRGLLHLGDMTDSGLSEEWKDFEAVYGQTGHDGLLKYPVFETVGNHDIAGDSPVTVATRRRHGSLLYSWDWDDLHLVCLGLYPDAQGLAWLAKDLRAIGRERPLVVFFHYSIEGPYSESWTSEEKEAFAKAIEGYNVLAIFHGHYHRAGRYSWRGHDVFLPGSPRHGSHAFLAARIGADQLAIGFWDFDTRSWLESFVKTIRR